MHVLEDNLKREYIFAIETEPELVKAETPFINFLKIDNFNTTKACHRLAMYWKRRREIFGEDRWLLPMIQTGSGALSASAIEVLRSGCFMPVPNCPVPFVVTDLSRLDRSMGHADALETMFYFGTIAMSEFTQMRPITVLHRVHNQGHRCELVPGLGELMETALPMHSFKRIVVSTVDESSQLLGQFLTLQAVKMVEYNTHSSPNVIDTGSLSKRLQLIEATGIPRQHVPSCMGGCLTETDQHNNWVRTRISVEEMLGSVIRNNSMLALNNGTAGAIVSRRRHATLSTNNGEKPPTNKNNNAVHHQRWLARQELKKKALHAKYKLEQNYNAQLVATHQRLTSLLAQAKYIVALHTAKQNQGAVEYE